MAQFTDHLFNFRRDIQASSAGHCSIEDAKTCMELVLLKLKHGASYGEPVSDDESVFQAVERAGKIGLSTFVVLRMLEHSL